jgi:hypothetical protein
VAVEDADSIVDREEVGDSGKQPGGDRGVVTQPPVQHLLPARWPPAVLESGVQQQRFLDAGPGSQEPQHQHIAGDELQGIRGIFVPAPSRPHVVAVGSDPVVQTIEDALDLLVDNKRPAVGVTR